MDKVIALNCPGCNQPVSTDQAQCKFCKRPIVVQKIRDIQTMPATDMTKYMNFYKSIAAENPTHKSLNGALAICYINMKMYDKAIEIFNKIMDDNVDNPDLFFNTAICHLHGKKPFSCQRSDIDEVIKYANASNSLQPRAITYLFLSYVKHDYFTRKYLQINPSWLEELEAADSYGANEDTIKELSEILNIQLPEDITNRFMTQQQTSCTTQKNESNNNVSTKSTLSSLISKFKRW